MYFAIALFASRDRLLVEWQADANTSKPVMFLFVCESALQHLK